MNPDKNPTVLSDACAVLGIPTDAEPRVHMARLMNLPRIQSVSTATVTMQINDVLCQKTFVENECRRIMSCQHAAGVKTNDEQAHVEATRRWERRKKKTLLDDDKAIANDQVGNMVDEMQHNGWKLVLMDDQNHYYRFPVKAQAPAADVPEKPSDDTVKVHAEENEVNSTEMTALVAENADSKRRLSEMTTSMPDHPTEENNAV